MAESHSFHLVGPLQAGSDRVNLKIWLLVTP
jgi:hypothetical protein